MNAETQPDSNGTRNGGWLSRERGQVLVLIVATLITVYLCYLLVAPFLAALAWALALAVVASPLHRWIARRIKSPAIAAGITILLIAVVIVAPMFFVMQSLVGEAAGGVQMLQQMSAGERWRDALGRNPQLAAVAEWVEAQVDLQSIAQRVIATVTGFISTVVSGSVTAVMGLLITFFTLFYFLRDRDKALMKLQSLMPLSTQEAGSMMNRVADTIYATVYGTLAVSMVQGILGGLMFWWLGLPAPILWGFVMGLLGVVPVLGAFVIWIPAAILLALEGEWVKALILTGWGGIVIATVDNLLYPMFVGKRLRLHTLPVFFSIVGGLIAFGASGLILGPMVLAIADALVQIWRHRTADGRTAEQTAEPLIVPAGEGGGS